MLSSSLANKTAISSGIHMAIIEITISIKNYVSMFSFLFFKMLWCMTSTTQLAFYHRNDNLYFYLMCHYFRLFYSFFHIIVPFLVIKCLFENSFMIMSITMIPTTTTTTTNATTMTMKI